MIPITLSEIPLYSLVIHGFTEKALSKQFGSDDVLGDFFSNARHRVYFRVTFKRDFKFCTISDMGKRLTFCGEETQFC